MSNIPKLRFPEFKGEWEEKKLGECLTLLYGKDWKDKSSTKKLYPVLGTGGVISYIDEFIYDKPCVLIGRKGSINNPVFIDKPFWTVDTQFYSKIHEGYSPKFLYYIFCTENWSKHDESTGVPSLSAKNVENTHKHIPSYSEQQKIADFLSNVDSIITAETKILNTLQKKKKALMQKLFTRQLRFKSADGTDFPAWEESTLEKECDYVDYRGKTPKKVSTGIFLVTAKNIKLGYIDYECSKEYIAENDYNEVMHRGKVKLGDVLITTEAPCGNVAQIDNENVALAQRVIKYSSKGRLNNTFLKYYFLSDLFRTIINEKATGSTVKGIKGSVLHKQKVIVPSLEEQQKIADCLSSLDSLIQTQQKVVTTWQQRKKALLQQMFI